MSSFSSEALAGGRDLTAGVEPAAALMAAAFAFRSLASSRFPERAAASGDASCGAGLLGSGGHEGEGAARGDSDAGDAARVAEGDPKPGGDGVWPDGAGSASSSESGIMKESAGTILAGVDDLWSA